MKIPLVGDLHFGVKNDARFMYDMQKSFMMDILLPYMKENNINFLIQFGDFFDRRKYTNHETLYNLYNDILKPYEREGIEMLVDVGNHDVYFKNTNQINTVDLYLSQFSNIIQVQEPAEYIFDGVKLLVVPWICQENYERVMEAIQNTDAEYLIGHFEIIGFEMYAGVENTIGLNPKMFKKFKEVWSGHFHHKSFKSNIRYIGTPYEMTWADADDRKGFYVFDTETRSVEFIENKTRLHEKIFYDDSNENGLNYIKNIDYSLFDNKIIKVIVQHKTNSDLYENFIDNLYKQKIVDLTVNEDMSEFYEQNVDIVSENVTTGKLINDYIDNVDTSVNKEKLKNILQKLHIEASLGLGQ